MRKFLNTMLAAAASAFAIVSCEKVVVSVPESELVQIEVNASAESTKTHLDGTLQVKWNPEGEVLRLIEKEGTSFVSAASTSVEVAPDGTTARFTAALPENTATALDYWGIYPEKHFIDSRNTDLQRFKVALPEIQHPVSGSFDPEADLLISSKVHRTSQPASALDFHFHRLVAVVRVAVEGITPGENILSATFSNTTAPLAGRSYYNMETDRYVEIGYPGMEHKEIALKFSQFKASGNDVFHFTALPASMKDFTLKVVTDKAVYSKIVENLSEPLAFSQNHLVPLRIKDMTRVENVNDGYTLLTTAEEYTLKAGDQVIIANSKADGPARVFGAQSTKRRLSLEGATVSGGMMNSLPEGCRILRIEDGLEAGTFALVDDSEVKGKYIFAPADDGNLESKDDLDKQSSWTVLYDQKGAKFKNVAYPKSRTIGFNSINSLNEFGFYNVKEETEKDNLLAYIFYKPGVPKTALETPSNVKAEVAEGTNVATVTWDAVANAASYTVSCGAVHVNSTTSSAILEGLSWNKTNTISVVAHPAKGSEEWRSSLAATCEAVVGANPNPETLVTITAAEISAAGLGVDKIEKSTSVTVGDFTFVFAPGEGSNRTYYSSKDKHIRFYTHEYMTIQSSGIMKKVVINRSKDGSVKDLAADPGKISIVDKEIVWTGSTSVLELQATAQSRINSITITYE